MAFYDRGMQSLTDEDRDEALHYFDQVLHRPMSLEVRKNPPPGKKQSQRFCEGSVKAEGDPLHAVLNVCKASLKQKASLIVDVAPLEALEHLKEVYKLEPSDMVLCKNFGTLVNADSCFTSDCRSRLWKWVSQIWLNSSWRKLSKFVQISRL